MSKIETMRNSSSTAAQQRGMQTVIELQETLRHLSPVEIEQSMAQVQQTAAVFGDLIAQELITVSKALNGLIQQATDVTNELKKTLAAADQQTVKSTQAMIKARQALALIQKPPEAEKTALKTLLALAPAVSVVISLLTLVVVLIQV